MGRAPGRAAALIVDGGGAVAASAVHDRIQISHRRLGATVYGRPRLVPYISCKQNVASGQLQKDHVLSARRRQYLIAPGLGSAAHAAQGQRASAVSADLREGSSVSWMASYVAISRVRRREKLLILCLFEREPYASGEMEGTRLLRQQTSNLAAIEEQHAFCRHE